MAPIIRFCLGTPIHRAKAPVALASRFARTTERQAKDESERARVVQSSRGFANHSCCLGGTGGHRRVDVTETWGHVRWVEHAGRNASGELPTSSPIATASSARAVSYALTPSIDWARLLRRAFNIDVLRCSIASRTTSSELLLTHLSRIGDRCRGSRREPGRSRPWLTRAKPPCRLAGSIFPYGNTCRSNGSSTHGRMATPERRCRIGQAPEIHATLPCAREGITTPRVEPSRWG
jgi:hypothetical protein